MFLFFFPPLAFLFDTSIAFDTTHNLEKYLFHEFGDKKNHQNSKQKNRPVHTLSSSPITTTFASYSTSFAILLACCERRRLRFNTLHPFPTIPLSSLREGRILSSAYVSFLPVGPPMMYRTRAVTLLLEVACS